MTWTASVPLKWAMELQVEACMKEEDEVAAATHRHLQPGQGHPEGKEASLDDETFKMLMFMTGNKHHVTICWRIF